MAAYDVKARAALEAYMNKPEPLLLAIESSCDETAAAVIQNGRRVVSTSVHTQIPIHREFGGVVPELASRSHVEKVRPVTDMALERAGLSYEDMDGIAVTMGPGLVGALLVGASYAKGIAYSLGLPIIGVNHIAGHIAANYITYPELEPPFTCIVASGGHSHIVDVAGYNEFALIGRTRDDAAGEAFDKCARALGLPYPGGPELERLASTGDPHKYRFHSAFNDGDTDDFSFSGIKTAAVNLMHNAQQRGESVDSADIAASFQYAVVSALVKKSVRCAIRSGHGKLALAGGVSANTPLREALKSACDAEGIAFYRPDMKYCTDNAAMIGCAGHYLLREGTTSDMTLNPCASLSFELL